MKRNDLTVGNVRKTILALALPLVGSSFLQFTYSLVDMFWVGALGSDAVASIGAASFYIMLGQSLQALIVVGAGIKVAQAVGAKNEEMTARYVRSGLRANGVIGVLYMSILIAFGAPLIAFLNMNSPEVEGTAYRFLLISAPMLFFSFYNLLHARLFSSFGNTTAAMRINMIGVIANIILSPILIYPLGLGVFGAGVATLIAQIAMYVLFRQRANSLFRFAPEYTPKRHDYVEIARLGFPMATQRLLFTAVGILLGRMIGSYGTEAIAAQRIGLQIESVAYMMIGGLNGAIASFTGQNVGANKLDRVHEGYNASIRMGVLYTGVISLLFIFLPEPLIGLFVNDGLTIDIGANYLRIVGFSLMFAAVEMIGNGFFSGLGLPKIPATISIVFTVARIPLAMALEPWLGINAIWWSIALSSIIKGIASAVMYQIKRKEVTSVAHKL